MTLKLDKKFEILLYVSSNILSRANVPLHAPILISFWKDLFGIKVESDSLKINLPLDCVNKWTVGDQPPDTHSRSHFIFP